MLTFSVISMGIEDNVLKFKIVFENPLYVSTGTQNDRLVGEIIDGSFFSDKDSGLSIATGTKITHSIPKLLPGEGYAETLEAVEETAATVT